MSDKMNKFAQLYNGKVVFIYETPLTIDKLPLYFDPTTVWVDVTDYKQIEVGYVQGFDKNGKFILKPSLKDVLPETLEEKVRRRIAELKIERDDILNALAKKKYYLSARDCYTYLNSENKKASDEAKRLLDYRDYMDTCIWELKDSPDESWIDQNIGIHTIVKKEFNW